VLAIEHDNSAFAPKNRRKKGRMDRVAWVIAWLNSKDSLRAEAKGEKGIRGSYESDPRPPAWQAGAPYPGCSGDILARFLQPLLRINKR